MTDRQPHSSIGAFSISLSVGDLAASAAFYEKLGFSAMGGDGVAWSIMSNGPAVIGLFQGMFEGNILTFNPGWDQAAQPLDQFTDVRTIARDLEAAGIALQSDTTGDSESGPAAFMVVDPDGNPVLVDQHV